MIPSSQLSSDDFRNVRQTLIIPLTSSQPSSISALILGLDVFFRSASPKFEWKENVRNEFSICLDTDVHGVYPRAKVAKRRRVLHR